MPVSGDGILEIVVDALRSASASIFAAGRVGVVGFITVRQISHLGV
jgi:hypothetical protein